MLITPLDVIAASMLIALPTGHGRIGEHCG